MYGPITSDLAGAAMADRRREAAQVALESSVARPTRRARRLPGVSLSGLVSGFRRGEPRPAAQQLGLS
jgi:hypothetical protein